MLNLFKPGRIGKLQIKNRIVMAPMGAGGLIELDGRFSQRGIDYYAARARGGTGLIITGILYVDVEIEPHLVGSSFVTRPRVDSPLYLARLEELANAVHAYGAKIALQLTAGRGRIAPAADQKAGNAVAPSPVPCFWSPYMIARELTIEEIEVLVNDFGIAAGIVKSAGIDAIELHAHEGYMIDQFMTSLWNKRTDKYGGDLEGRLRFPLEIIESMRAEVGTDFPIMYKFGANHQLEGGRDVEESCEIARRLQEAGVDAFEVDAGCYETSYWAHPPTYMPPGCLLDGIEAIKKIVDVPVIAVGKLGYPELAEEVLKEGKADFIALGRPLLADPEWPIKVKEERLDDIIVCLGCHDGCFRRSVSENKYLSCTVNPVTGMEKELALTPTQTKKNVLVVGGGPGGMEAARVAALRGHNVTLWEKSDKLGGNLVPASVPDFKSDYAAFKHYLSSQIRKLGVDIRFMMEATSELVQKEGPDEVIIATGSTPIIPELVGVSQEKVITAVDALLGNSEVGDEIVVVGGGEVGCETAVWLTQRGKRVTVVEILPDILEDMYFMNKMMLRKMLDEAGIGIVTDAKVSEVTKEGIVIQRNSDTEIFNADTVVLAVGMKAEKRLLDDMEGKLPTIHSIGDCVEPRRLINAIWEAYNIARLI
ncbi:FAD-dependent oxidoreductase [Chloroflexota bacterium]